VKTKMIGSASRNRRVTGRYSSERLLPSTTTCREWGVMGMVATIQAQQVHFFLDEQFKT